MFIHPAAPARVAARMGLPPTLRQFRQLENLVKRTAIGRGTLKGRRMPDGFTPRQEVSTTIAVNASFQVSYSEGDEGAGVVTISPGTAGGIPAKINGIALDDTDADGNAPTLAVPEDAWSPHGNVMRCLILLQYDLEHSGFSIVAVTPIAAAAPPAAAPFTWWKTIAWLTKTSDGTVNVNQRVFFDQYFLVANAKADGSFQPLPYIAG